MVVQHNLSAFNASIMLGITSGLSIKSSEKLSSGYKINRSADDAAGLSISEKMRRQIRGLNQAVANSQDGISMCQIADGALDEIHDMLHRCSELSIKAANGTLSQSDRQDVQYEIEQIRDEIDGIADRTKFNEIQVLKGNGISEGSSNNIRILSREVVFHRADNDHVSQYIQYTNNTTSSLTPVSSGVVYDNQSTFTMDFSRMTSPQAWADMDGTGFCFTCTAGCGQQFAFTFDNSSNVITDNTDGVHIENGGVKNNKHYTIGTRDFTNYTDLMNAFQDILNGLHPDGLRSNYVGHINTMTISGAQITLSGSGSDSYMEVSAGVAEVIIQSEGYDYRIPASPDMERNGLSIHAGADSLANNKIDVLLPAISSKLLGIEDIDVTKTEMQYDNKLDLTKEVTVGANQAIDKFAEAIFYVSNERSRMGAYQNRMEHTIRNLNNTVENTTTAESGIRDTDMAKEMVKFSNLQILQQAGQSMLTQANQSNQGVLSLIG